MIFPDGITEMNSPPFGAGLGLATEGVDPELQWAGARSHNRWLAELCQMAPERHIGVAIVPAFWDVDEAVHEVRWARENGLRGILLPVVWGKLPPYHLRRYDPLWAVCRSSRCRSTSTRAPPLARTPSRLEPDGTLATGAMGIYMSEVCWWLVRPLTFLIWGGVFERHPELRVAVTEGSCIWVPEYLALLDHRYSAHHANAKMGDFTSHLPLQAERLLPPQRRRRRVGARAARGRDARGDRCRVASCGAATIRIRRAPGPRPSDSRVEACAASPRRRSPRSSAATRSRFYGFDAEKLAPIAARIGPEQSAFE